MKSFKPAWWCRGAHAQTLFGTLFRQKPRLTFQRKRLETPDGDFLDLDFLDAPSSNNENTLPLVIILHGLEGSSEAPYVQSLMGEVLKHGWDSVAVNMRMCSGVPNRLKQTYHSGKSEDLEYVVDYLREKEKRQALYLIGFSIGGNIVLKWLGEKGNAISQEIKKATVISVPYDLTASVKLMDNGFNRYVYTRSLLTSLKAKIRMKEAQYPAAIHYGLAKRCTTFRAFDREVTAPLNGFRDEADYWTKTSCKNFLKTVAIPTLLIHAQDDPFFPGKMLPMDAIRNCKHLQVLMTHHGGHLGFIAGRWPWKQESWFERRIIEFFSTV